MVCEGGARRAFFAGGGPPPRLNTGTSVTMRFIARARRERAATGGAPWSPHITTPSTVKSGRRVGNVPLGRNPTAENPDGRGELNHRRRSQGAFQVSGPSSTLSDPAAQRHIVDKAENLPANSRSIPNNVFERPQPSLPLAPEDVLRLRKGRAVGNLPRTGLHEIGRNLVERSDHFPR